MSLIKLLVMDFFIRLWILVPFLFFLFVWLFNPSLLIPRVQVSLLMVLILTETWKKYLFWSSYLLLIITYVKCFHIVEDSFINFDISIWDILYCLISLMEDMLYIWEIYIAIVVQLVGSSKLNSNTKYVEVILVV